jgi:outer membrane protein TolC
MNRLTSKGKTTKSPKEGRALNTFLFRLLLILSLQVTFVADAWAQTSEPDSPTPLLTLDEAIRIATGANRDIRISKLEIVKAQETVAQARTNYFPKLDANVLAGAPLQPLNFAVLAGTFGTYPGIGPIPGKNSNITSPVRLGAFVNASAAQPLTQLFRVNLAAQQARLGINLAKEGVRAQSQETVQQVKEAYYQVAQLQAQVASARAAVQTLTELSTLTGQRLAQETVLQSESLTVKAKLKQQRYQLLAAEDALVLQKQNLNRLLGRGLRTPLSVQMLAFGELVEWDLDTARKQALEQRPEVREAKLQTKIADMDVRREHANYIPDLSVQVS